MKKYYDSGDDIPAREAWPVALVMMAAILGLLALATLSPCSGAREVEHVYHTEYIQDTLREYVRDLTARIEIEENEGKEVWITIE